jgi:hypothetical protein
MLLEPPTLADLLARRHQAAVATCRIAAPPHAGCWWPAPRCWRQISRRPST